jgi:Protein of unknown function (DUF2752)
MTGLDRRRRLLIRASLLALAVVGVVVVGAVLVLVPPTDDSWYPKCQLHSITGLHCPGCGLTRSVHSILNGEFRQALAYNALWPLVLPVIAIALIRSFWSWAWGDSVERSKPTTRLMPRWTPHVLIVLLVTFAIARNIPYHPFTLLAPHELK